MVFLYDESPQGINWADLLLLDVQSFDQARKSTKTFYT